VVARHRDRKAGQLTGLRGRRRAEPPGWRANGFAPAGLGDLEPASSGSIRPSNAMSMRGAHRNLARTRVSPCAGVRWRPLAPAVMGRPDECHR